MGDTYTPAVDAYWAFRDLNTIYHLNDDPLRIGNETIASVGYAYDGAVRLKSAAGTGLPKYATIGKATLSIKAYATTSFSDYWNVTAAKGDIRSLSPYSGDGPLTTAYTHWAVPNPFTVDSVHDIDVTAVIQELVDELAAGQTLDELTLLIVPESPGALWYVSGAVPPSLSVEWGNLIAGRSTFAASLTRARGLSGTIAGQSVVTVGNLACVRRFVGNIEAAATFDGRLREMLAGTIAGQSAFSAVLTRPATPRSLAGTIAGRGWFGSMFPSLVGPVQMQEGCVYQGIADAHAIWQGMPENAVVHQGVMDAGKVLPT